MYPGEFLEEVEELVRPREGPLGREKLYLGAAQQKSRLITFIIIIIIIIIITILIIFFFVSLRRRKFLRVLGHLLLETTACALRDGSRREKVPGWG